LGIPVPFIIREFPEPLNPLIAAVVASVPVPLAVAVLLLLLLPGSRSAKAFSRKLESRSSMAPYFFKRLGVDAGIDVRVGGSLFVLSRLVSMPMSMPMVALAVKDDRCRYC